MHLFEISFHRDLAAYLLDQTFVKAFRFPTQGSSLCALNPISVSLFMGFVIEIIWYFCSTKNNKDYYKSNPIKWRIQKIWIFIVQ